MTYDKVLYHHTRMARYRALTTAHQDTRAERRGRGNLCDLVDWAGIPDQRGLDTASVYD